MKKICTITCHDVYNAGASLQAYALMKYLQNQDYEVEIINYKPKYLRHFELFNINPKFNKNIFTKIIYLVIKVPKRIYHRVTNKRKHNYDRFTKKYLTVTKKKYSSNEDLKSDIPEAEIYIAGSDQIWNPILDNGRDPSFYLDFVPNNKVKISYAGSFAVSELPNDIKVTVKEHLEKFDAISVRESSAISILEDLEINTGVAVLDPVFLLSKEEWLEICPKLNLDKYVLVYDFDWSEDIKMLAQKVAKEKGYKIYSVLKCDYADESFYDIGPDAFVSLVTNAELVLSNSFHATAFSLILKKQFFTFRRNWKLNTRMEDLLNDAGVEDRLIDSIDIDVDSKLDWNKIDHKLAEKINVSKQFLKNNLEIL